jgi:hypothetical protein
MSLDLQEAEDGGQVRTNESGAQFLTRNPAMMTAAAVAATIGFATVFCYPQRTFRQIYLLSDAI